MIRAELDPTFMEKKRNKVLWEVISNKMKEKGYNRSAEQCKCKWKNLFTRYKVCMCICSTILLKNLRNGEKVRDWIGNICLLICFIE